MVICGGWKGIMFSDMLWVTRRKMAAAVENLNKHLDSVTDSLSVEEARTSLFNIEYDLHALRRTISGLDGKLCSLEEKQDKTSCGIMFLSFCATSLKERNCMKVIRTVCACTDIHTYIGMHMFVCMYMKQDGKLCSLEDKQDKTNRGIMFLCDFVEGKKLPEGYKEQLKLPSSISSSARGLLTQAEAPVLNGLKDLFADPSSTGRFNISGTMAKRQDVVADGSDVPKSLQRTISARC